MLRQEVSNSIQRKIARREGCQSANEFRNGIGLHGSLGYGRSRKPNLTATDRKPPCARKVLLGFVQRLLFGFLLGRPLCSGNASSRFHVVCLAVVLATQT